MQMLGQYLKSEREKKGIRLEEIASSTKINIQNLVLMEEIVGGNFLKSLLFVVLLRLTPDI